MTDNKGLSAAALILAAGHSGGGGSSYTAGSGINITNNVISTIITIPSIPDQVNKYALKCNAGTLYWEAESVSPQGEVEGPAFTLTGNSYVDDNRLYVED